MDRIERINKNRQYVEIILARVGDKKFFEWLFKIGFYEAPASFNHHRNYDGGLYEHSFTVTEELVKLTKCLNLKWSRPESPYIVGLLHDICKTDDYSWDFSNPDNSKLEMNENRIMKGEHGSKSVKMLEGHINLTEEEIKCIRYHMGAFVEKEEWSEYSDSIREFPNVLFTHTADMMASQLIELGYNYN